MIFPKVLEPESKEAEIESINETIRWIVRALESGDPTGNIEKAIRKLCAERETVEARPHRGLVDYDQRIHG